jgi:hypothetical protein
MVFLPLARATALAAFITAPAVAQDASARVDPELDRFIAGIRAVDHHSHVNTVDPGDTDSDALPLEVLPQFPVPVTLRPEHPNWLSAYRALYDYRHPALDEAHLAELRSTMQRVRAEQGETFPTWVLDRIGIDVMFANRVAMGPGLVSPRFRWVSFVDALMLPLADAPPSDPTPDRDKLQPFEAKLLGRYLGDLRIDALPATLDAYLDQVVTPTLARQQRNGCIAVKFEAALFRSLDFAEVSRDRASAVYARYAKGGTPSPAEYKALQDFLFRHIAREAGRLGMAVHIHAFEGPGAFYQVAGSDPLLLEPVFDDPTLRDTNFVIVHGGGVFARHAGAMFWKPNVYVDTSAMALIYTPDALASVLRDWLRSDPERVLFGTDAAAFGPDTGWELAAWIATTQARRALCMALTEMMRLGEIDRARAQQIATLVMRGNAARLYRLESK